MDRDEKNRRARVRWNKNSKIINARRRERYKQKKEEKLQMKKEPEEQRKRILEEEDSLTEWQKDILVKDMVLTNYALKLGTILIDDDIYASKKELLRKHNLNERVRIESIRFSEIRI